MASCGRHITGYDKDCGYCQAKDRRESILSKIKDEDRKALAKQQDEAEREAAREQRKRASKADSAVSAPAASAPSGGSDFGGVIFAAILVGVGALFIWLSGDSDSAKVTRVVSGALLSSLLVWVFLLVAWLFCRPRWPRWGLVGAAALWFTYWLGREAGAEDVWGGFDAAWCEASKLAFPAALALAAISIGASIVLTIRDKRRAGQADQGEPVAS